MKVVLYKDGERVEPSRGKTIFVPLDPLIKWVYKHVDWKKLYQRLTVLFKGN